MTRPPANVSRAPRQRFCRIITKQENRAPAAGAVAAASNGAFTGRTAPHGRARDEPVPSVASGVKTLVMTANSPRKTPVSPEFQSGSLNLHRKRNNQVKVGKHLPQHAAFALMINITAHLPAPRESSHALLDSRITTFNHHKTEQVDSASTANLNTSTVGETWEPYA